MDRLDWCSKLYLLRRYLGEFRDALLLQTRILEDEMFQDLRFGVRMLLEQPGITLIAVLTLALGTTVSAAIYSVEQGVIAQGKENAVNSSSQNVPVLEAGKPVEREIKGGEVHIYQISLRSGGSVSGDVYQRGIAISVI